MNWIPLSSEEQLLQLKSQDKPSVIFKHSTRCHISNMALRFFERDWEENPNVNMYFLDILEHRSLSQQIAESFHVHHESPQLILIHNGECILNASHQDISAKEVQELLATS